MESPWPPAIDLVLLLLFLVFVAALVSHTVIVCSVVATAKYAVTVSALA